jgi:hypothetical protein
MSRGEKARLRGHAPTMEGRDGLDRAEMPAQNADHRAASHGESRREGRTSIMLVELVDEIGDRDMNDRELHEALARLLLRYHAKTHNRVGALP